MFLVRIPKDCLAINKQDLASFCLYSGILVAYLGSLNPWFMWPLGTFYIIIASFLLCISMAVQATLKENTIFNSNYYLIPTALHFVLSYYMLFVNGGHIGGFIFNLFNVFIFYAIFRLSKELLFDIVAFLSKAMAILLAISITGFILYLLGFPLPSTDVEFADGFYSYRNYFLFLLDNRSQLDIFPRFHSVFLEPGHLGGACVLLLLTQYGKWRKWYNVVLLVATLMSFSLAAYVLLVITIILNLWVLGKHFIGKIVASALILAAVVVGSFYYNNGDNLLHNLIILRLEVYDGDIVGNNRVTADFDVEYENFLGSSDILLGRDMPNDLFGNSGYKVFIYENGIIGLLLVILLYIAAMWFAPNRKTLIAAVILALLIFIVRGYPLWYSNFIPLIAMAHSKNHLKIMSSEE